jgi:hypothetical protein
MSDKRIILGENAMAAIAAVEGIQLSPEVKGRISKLRKAGKSNDEIRAAIIADFRARAAA